MDLSVARSVSGSLSCLSLLDLVWTIVMEEDKNKIFVNAMVNFGYKRADVNVALARSLGNEEVRKNGMATILQATKAETVYLPWL